MTSRCNLITRAAALFIFALALWAVPPAAHAQTKCACDYYTFMVDKDVECKVEICWTFSQKGPVYCATLEPGTSYRIPCPVYEAYITYCDGSYTVIGNLPPAARCSPILQVGRLCCARACWTSDAYGCPAIRIVSEPCLARDCWP